MAGNEKKESRELTCITAGNHKKELASIMAGDDTTLTSIMAGNDTSLTSIMADDENVAYTGDDFIEVSSTELKTNVKSAKDFEQRGVSEYDIGALQLLEFGDTTDTKPGYWPVNQKRWCFLTLK